MLNMLAASSSGEGNALLMVVQILPLILIFVVMYFILIRPQKKKDKETQKMRSNVQIGDEITTIGGIVGIIVSIKEDVIVIETAGERNKIRLKRWAIQSNETIHDDLEG
jgi:preprotein translocase subunit YajC